MSKTITCKNHCSACGRHFSSTAAFDRHRRGSYQDGRYCIEPGVDDEAFEKTGEWIFEALSTSGECRMYDDGSGRNIKRGVIVWTLRKTPAQREWFAKQHAAAATASGINPSPRMSSEASDDS
jgi:hypothetical protein